MDFGVALTEDDYKHFSVLRSNPNEISDACDICAVSSTNNQKIDEIIYGKQLTNIEQKRQYKDVFFAPTRRCLAGRYL